MDESPAPSRARSISPTPAPKSPEADTSKPMPKMPEPFKAPAFKVPEISSPARPLPAFSSSPAPPPPSFAASTHKPAPSPAPVFNPVAHKPTAPLADIENSTLASVTRRPAKTSHCPDFNHLAPGQRSGSACRRPAFRIRHVGPVEARTQVSITVYSGPVGVLDVYVAKSSNRNGEVHYLRGASSSRQTGRDFHTFFHGCRIRPGGHVVQWSRLDVRYMYAQEPRFGQGEMSDLRGPSSSSQNLIWVWSSRCQASSQSQSTWTMEL
jgi:hypothetical protein